jgi:uncharacterized Zn finger protein (UPF0148 family)
MDDEKWNKCPHCGVHAFAPRFGNRVTCRSCGTVFTVEIPDNGQKAQELMRFRPKARHRISAPRR